MNPIYTKGQRVIVRPLENRDSTVRDSTLEQFIGRVGRVTNYYWISPQAGEIFYLYTVRFDTGNQELVLYEDEIIPYLE